MLGDLPKHVHIIGIAGVATSAIAIALHKAGVKVTGSDKGFFPPVSTELEKHGIPFYAGWHPEKMMADGMPDLVITGAASGTQNPETMFARDQGIPSFSYPEIIGRYFVKKHSVVVAGTWGKTSSAALLSHILHEAGLEPGYMFGGISLSHKHAAHVGKSDWSVFEGDEYKSSPIDPRAKFFHYKPTRLLLTAVSWDHADLYPTEKSYFEAFEKLVKGMPSTGLIVANKDKVGVAKVLKGHKGKIVWYGNTSVTPAEAGVLELSQDSRSPKQATPVDGFRGNDNTTYLFEQVKQSKTGLDFMIKHGEESFTVKSPMLGAFQAENITGCFAMAHELGVPAEKIISAIASFKGMKRRLEKRFEGDITVFDDIAHSPEKAASVLKELRDIYDGKIIVVFEPNIGGRERDAAVKYNNAFKDANIVIIPRLTKLKVAEGKEPPMEGNELAATISKTHKDCLYMEDDKNLVNFLVSQTKKGDVIAFLGSHGFRGMIEETVTKLS